ncbi:hypothetical protein QVD17_38800 [Tagetes erecta]|uniref:DUF7950 domain-containing protein n=1 Tax=Tagetes erecta TaxID=13708 RepID=A0AAD8JR75_TARER|nr:hypothetical protein QVD17_38800 [Tagetes erecta]
MAAGSGSGSGSSCSTAEHSDGRNKRRKRKYVRVNKNKKDVTNTRLKKRKVVSSSPDEKSGGGDAVVTLSLMPETPDRKENLPNSPSVLSLSPTVSSAGENCNRFSPVLLSFNNHQSSRDSHVIKHTSPTLPPRKTVVTSFVTVECVTETWMNDGAGYLEGLAFTDQARVMNMEMDTCPSFITNSRDTVVWTNKAYREMITGGYGASDETTLVSVKKFNRVTMPVSHAAFTCQVKVAWGTERSLSTVTAPCDVWRMRSGGYAWRVDVKAALSLGRYS